MSQQTKPDLAVGDDLLPAFGIARRSGQRRGNRVAGHRVGPQLLRQRGRCAEPERGQYRPAPQPNTSPVIVLNQPSANWASSARFARGASIGLTPPAPSMSASTPFAGLYTPATVMP